MVCAAVLVQVAGVSGPNYIPCKEDDDLLSAFDKMMADSAQVGGRRRGGEWRRRKGRGAFDVVMMKRGLGRGRERRGEGTEVERRGGETGGVEGSNFRW